MRAFIRQLRPAVMALVVFTVLLGVVYPLVEHRSSARSRSATRPTVRSSCATAWWWAAS